MWSELTQLEGLPQGKTKLPPGWVPLERLPVSCVAEGAQPWSREGWKEEVRERLGISPTSCPSLENDLSPFPRSIVLSESSHPASHPCWGFLNLERTATQNSCPLRCQFWKWYYSEYSITLAPKAGNESQRALVTGIVWKNASPWLVWLSGLSAGLQTQRSLVWFSAGAHAWVAGKVPGWGEQEATNWCVSPYLPPFPSL